MYGLGDKICMDWGMNRCVDGMLLNAFDDGFFTSNEVEFEFYLILLALYASL